MIERTNAQWLADLTSTSEGRDAALNDSGPDNDKRSV
jgi:hypothetical protein